MHSKSKSANVTYGIATGKWEKIAAPIQWKILIIFCQKRQYISALPSQYLCYNVAIILKWDDHFVVRP